MTATPAPGRFPWQATLYVTTPDGVALSYASSAEDPAGLVIAAAAALGVQVTVHAAPLRAVDAPEAALRGDATPTSVAAAQRAFPRSGSRRRAIAAYLFANPAYGATDDELEQALNLRHQTSSAARRSLVLDGWICELRNDAGWAVTRKTRTGSDAIAWTLTPAGRHEMAREIEGRA